MTDSDEAARANASSPMTPTLSDLTAVELAETVPVGIMLLDAAGCVAFVSRRAAKYLDKDPENLMGAPLVAAVPVDNRQHLVVQLARLRDSPGEATVELAWTAEDRLVQLNLTSNTPPGKSAEGRILVSVLDVSDRLIRERQLEHRANHDTLTGLYNRARLLDLLHLGLSSQTELIVAFVDLDRFKSVNDRLGHAAGDAILTDVAHGIRDCLHPGEVAARVGGDEFVAVSKNLDSDGLADFAQRIMLAVATVRSARQYDVGVSVGLARSKSDDEPWSLLSRADKAMYVSKLERGRTISRSLSRASEEPR